MATKVVQEIPLAPVACCMPVAAPDITTDQAETFAAIFKALHVRHGLRTRKGLNPERRRWDEFRTGGPPGAARSCARCWKRQLLISTFVKMSVSPIPVWAIALFRPSVHTGYTTLFDAANPL